MGNIEILGGLLKRIGKFSMNTFNDRFFFQKRIYFLQAFKINLGYKFSLYHSGPYSSQLADDGYNLIEKFQELQEVFFIDEDLEKKFKEYLEFISKNEDNMNWMETMVLIHYFNQIKKNASQEEISKMIIDKKGKIDMTIFNEAWEHLKNFKLI
jgi:uncharacterized protein YwgA